MSIKEARGYTQVFKSTSFRQGLPESRTQGCESTEFRVARLVASFGIAIHGFWIPAQICLDQICINPKGVRQDSLT
jgi:hypothetical protein